MLNLCDDVLRLTRCRAPRPCLGAGARCAGLLSMSERAGLLAAKLPSAPHLYRYVDPRWVSAGYLPMTPAQAIRYNNPAVFDLLVPQPAACAFADEYSLLAWRHSHAIWCKLRGRVLPFYMDINNLMDDTEWPADECIQCTEAMLSRAARSGDDHLLLQLLNVIPRSSLQLVKMWILSVFCDASSTGDASTLRILSKDPNMLRLVRSVGVYRALVDDDGSFVLVFYVDFMCALRQAIIFARHEVLEYMWETAAQLGAGHLVQILRTAARAGVPTLELACRRLQQSLDTARSIARFRNDVTALYLRSEPAIRAVLLTFTIAP
jgi:hypothetical protein